ncbi:MAG: Na+/H+ antiporter subunit A [Clostridia bacterium]|nr:Na+/H+ antiporter subunit A [Clostridia bacterium]
MLHLSVIAPFLFAILVPFLRRYLPQTHTGWFVLPIPLTIAIYLSSFLPQIWQDEKIIRTIEWIPSLGINFTLFVDGLSLLFALLITWIGTLVVLYSAYYLDKKEALGNFYVYLLMFMGAMLGVVLSDNLVVLYVFWELTSLSSFLLIGFWYYRERSVYGAQKSMLITMAGGFAMLAGIVLLYVIAGTFSIRELIEKADVIMASELYLPTLILILLGAFTKSAQFPFHVWLPDAMEAPTPVSAYLHSATMVKAGLYLVARLTPVLAGTPDWLIMVSGVGIITLVWGAFIAIRQTDLKAILAFSTVSQLGLIMTLLGIGTDLAVTAAVFHLFNHSAFKGCLFMVAGIVDHEAGTRDIRKLGGLAALMPISATLAFIGTFAMAGIPPFNGFLSKEMFFDATWKAGGLDYGFLSWLGPVLPALAVLGSIFTFIYSMMLFFKTFKGSTKLDQLPKKPHEAPKGMLISPIVLGAIAVLVGLFPSLVAGTIVAPAAEAVTLVPQEVKISYWHGFTPPLLMTLTVVGLGTLIYWKLAGWLKVYAALPETLSINRFYDGITNYLPVASGKITGWYMTGSLRDYLAYILAAMSLILGFTLLSQGGIAFDYTNLAPIAPYEYLLVAIIVLAVFTIFFAQSRLVAIIALGIVGFVVSLLFIIFRAPDLALTQMIVETVSVSLFLLAFYHLPELKKEEVKPRTKFINILVSGAIGIIFALVAFSAHNTKLFETIAGYYLENSYKLGGGKNVVNVILVDFRGLDTMFEITVLAIAALGIYGLIKLRLTKKGE